MEGEGCRLHGRSPVRSYLNVYLQRSADGLGHTVWSWTLFNLTPCSVTVVVTSVTVMLLSIYAWKLNSIACHHDVHSRGSCTHWLSKPRKTRRHTAVTSRLLFSSFPPHSSAGCYEQWRPQYASSGRRTADILAGRYFTVLLTDTIYFVIREVSLQRRPCQHKNNTHAARSSAHSTNPQICEHCEMLLVFVNRLVKVNSWYSFSLCRFPWLTLICRT